MSKIKKPEIVFNYKKSNEYRNYHVDGVFGGILPTSNIWFDIFVEKRSIPEKVVYELDTNTGKLTEIDNNSVVKENLIIRELQAGFTMNLDTAKVIKGWLEEKIETIEKEMKKINK